MKYFGYSKVGGICQKRGFEVVYGLYCGYGGREKASRLLKEPKSLKKDMSFLEKLRGLSLKSSQLIHTVEEEPRNTSVDIEKAIDEFRSLPSGVSLGKLTRGMRGMEGVGYKPLPLSRFPRVGSVLAEFIRENPASYVTLSVREEMADCDDRDLRREFVVDFVVSPIRKAGFLYDELSEMRAKEGLVKKVLLSAVAGNGFSQEDLLGIYKEFCEDGDFYKTITAQNLAARKQVLELIGNIREDIVKRIHDGVLKFDLRSEKLVTEFYRLRGTASEERLFLISALLGLPQGLNLTFYYNLIDLFFANGSLENTELKNYINSRYERGNFVSRDPLDKAIAAMTKDFEEGREKPAYSEDFVADCIRGYYCLEGTYFEKGFNFLIRLVKNPKIRSNLAMAACWVLVNCPSFSGHTTYGVTIVKMVLGSVTAQDTIFYPDVFRRRNVLGTLSLLNRFVSSHKSVVGNLVEGEKRELGVLVFSLISYLRGEEGVRVESCDRIISEIEGLSRVLGLRVEEMAV